MQLAHALRKAYPQLGIVCHCGGGKYNSQLKRAFASGAGLAVILEAEAGVSAVSEAKIRRLDAAGESLLAPIGEIVAKTGEFLSNSA